MLNLDLPVEEWAQGRRHRRRPICASASTDAADAQMAQKAANVGPELMRLIEKSLLLQILDAVWKEHLLSLDHLRQGIGLRAYGQRDPLNEYKREAFALFKEMLNHLREAVTSVLCHVELRVQRADDQGQAAPGEPVPPPPRPRMIETRQIRPGPAAARYRMAIRPSRSRRRRRKTRRRRGRKRRATRPVPAGRARNSSTATAGSNAL